MDKKESISALRDTARLYNQGSLTGMVNPRLVAALLRSCESTLDVTTSTSPDVNSAVSRALVHALLFTLHNDTAKADKAFAILKMWTARSISVPRPQVSHNQPSTFAEEKEV